MDVVSQWFSIRPVAQGWLFPRADKDLEIRSAPFFQLRKEQKVAGVREPMQQANPGIEIWLGLKDGLGSWGCRVTLMVEKGPAHLVLVYPGDVQAHPPGLAVVRWEVFLWLPLVCSLNMDSGSLEVLDLNFFPSE